MAGVLDVDAGKLGVISVMSPVRSWDALAIVWVDSSLDVVGITHIDVMGASCAAALAVRFLE